jgi:glycosyltransferase involved in cell wall biosynthesis
MRILYSFPHAVGKPGIGTTAFHQVAGAIRQGIEVVLYCTSLERELDGANEVVETLAFRGHRIPHRALGLARAYRYHDRRVARALRRQEPLDLVHCWPAASLATFRAARALGIPCVREVPNTHTGYAFDAVARETAMLGLDPVAGHSHTFAADALRREEAEYELADRLLCPSDFVVQTFLDQGVPAGKLVRHIYGYDPATFHPGARRPEGEGLTVLFVGVAAVRKGLHFALEAWLRSSASRTGRFLIAGEVLPAYGERLAAELAHPSVSVLGHRDDVPDLMRQSDVLVLPSIEEGFGLVCTEAAGSGCVPLVSDACTDLCRHLENALVHPVGDVDALEKHLTMLHEDRELLSRLRAASLDRLPEITWSAAGRLLLDAYDGNPVAPGALARI